MDIGEHLREICRLRIETAKDEETIGEASWWEQRLADLSEEYEHLFDDCPDSMGEEVS